ncbi:MAG: site-specific DNA-methyltransferase, partial [Elusimicrobia bacterium CG08_land_8_20_14_0_20_51_18]
MEEKDEAGYLLKEGLFRKNSKENGHYHSNWLSMMYPRLFLARNLLRDDGVIFISIDDNEVHNLRLLLNEVFGEENFVASIIWHSTKSVTNTALVSVAHTYNLVYMKNKSHFIENRTQFRLSESGEGFSNPDNDPRGPWKADPFQVGGWRPNQQYKITNPTTGKIYKPNPGCSWKNDYNKFLELSQDNRIIFGATGEAGPQRKRFLYEAEERGKVVTTLWDNINTTTNATRYLKELFGKNIFDNPKPADLITRFAQLSTLKNGMVLDFFAGSATTAQAIMELNKEDDGNRQYICVQLPEKTEEDTEAFKAGYKTIAEIGKERIRRVIKKIKTEGAKPGVDLGFKVYKLKNSNFKIWRGDVVDTTEDLEKQMDMLKDPVKPEAQEQNLLWELLLK